MLVLLLLGVGLTSPLRAESVLYGVGGDFKGFDPVDAGDVESAEQISRVFEGLLEYDYLVRPYRVVPRLAEALPEVAADNLTYTFRLKKGVRFSDDACFPGGKGREVTAEDFIFSLKRILDPKLQSQGSWILENHLLGVAEWQKNGKFDAPLPGLVATDRHTLQIKLSKPYPQLLWVLTMQYAFVLPREAVEFYQKDFRSHPVGTGPFRLKSWRRRYRIEYERNPSFSGQNYPSEGAPGDKEAGLLEDAGKALPLVDRIIEYDVKEFYTLWQMFLGGHIFAGGLNKDHFEKAITPQLDLSDDLKQRGIRLYKTPEMSTYYIGFNMQDPVVGASPDPVVNEKRKKLRQGFACALDMARYCKFLTNGRSIPANSPIPPGVPGYTDAPYPYRYDRERAKQLLAEAGYPGGKDAKGNPLRLTMITAGAGSADARQAAEFYMDQLRQVGIELVVQALSFPEYLRREYEGNFQLAIAGWIIDYPDAENFLKLFYGPNKIPGVNVTSYQNPEFDKLYDQIAVMPDSPERTALYQKMAAMTMEDCPWALLTYPLTYGLYQPWFQNYKPHAFPYANMKYYKVLPH
jgi:ABC-type transport system substrate-binding protein